MIESLKVSIVTSREFASSLQLEVSTLFYDELKYRISARLNAYCESHSIQKTFKVHRLILNIGILPRNHFYFYFCQKVMTALDEALMNLSVPPSQISASVVDEGFDESMASQEYICFENVFVKFLRTGYWPVKYEIKREGENFSEVSDPRTYAVNLLENKLQEDSELGLEIQSTLSSYAKRVRFLQCLPGSFRPQWIMSSSSEALNTVLLLRLSETELDGIADKKLIGLEKIMVQAFRNEEPSELLRWMEHLITAFKPVIRKLVWPVLSALMHNSSAPLRSDILPVRNNSLPVRSDTSPVWNNTSRVRSDNSAVRNNTSPVRSDISPVRNKASLFLTSELRVHHAGLILLWPLLPRWFSGLGLVAKAEENAPFKFVSITAQAEAIAFLDVLAWHDNEGGEWRSMLSKLLCDWPPEVPLMDWPDLERMRFLREAAEKYLQDTLMQIQQIQLMQGSTRPGLQKLAVQDVRALFLQRDGVLKEKGYGWQLAVTPHPADLLLRAIPWPLEQIIYPWMRVPLTVSWKRPAFPG